jgi:hypothetical protein
LQPYQQKGTPMSLNQKTNGVFTQLTALEVPYRQSLVRDTTRHTYDDPRNSAATEARYTSYLAFFGVKSLNIHQEIPRHKEQIQLGEFLWEFGLMDMEKVYQAPEWVCDRMAALQKANVPFAWFLYAEERFVYPKVEPTPSIVRAPEIQKTQRKRDPAIIGVIPTDYERRIGWWYMIAAWLH